MKYIDSIKEARNIISRLNMHDTWFVDTEGTALDPHENKLLLLQIAVDDQEVYVFDFFKLPYTLLDEFMLGFMSPGIIKVFQNAKYDLKVLFHYTKQLVVNVHDTLVTEQILYAGLNVGGFGLDDIVKRRIGVTLDKSIRTTFGEVFDTGIFTPQQLDYASKDVLLLPEIYKQQIAEITNKNLDRVYQDEMLLVPVVALMEYTGMPFDPTHMQTLAPEFEYKIKESHQALQDIFIRAGVVNEIVFTKDGYYGFNAHSRDQMKALFHAVGIDLKDLNAKTISQWDLKNKKRAKHYNIDFNDYVDDDDLATTIESFSTLENDYLRAYNYYVGISKLYDNYIIGLPKLVNPITLRVHTTFNQARARTGRFGSSKPNLQNIAKDGKLSVLGIKGSIRQGFKTKQGRVLIIADYAGIELVIIADASGDMKLASVLGEPHNFVAQHVLGYKEITNENKKKEPHKYWRDGAKRVSYSIAYGVTGSSLADQINLDLSPVGVKFSAEQGDEFVRGWKELFSDAGKWLDMNARHVLEYGYVVDGVGRKRFWDMDLVRSDRWKRLGAQREGSNFPVQSLSAHMTKLGLIYTHNSLDLTKARLVSTVHDEIIVESVESYAEVAARKLKTGMEQAAKKVLKHLGDYVIVEPAISTKYDK